MQRCEHFTSDKPMGIAEADRTVDYAQCNKLYPELHIFAVKFGASSLYLATFRIEVELITSKFHFSQLFKKTDRLK